MLFEGAKDMMPAERKPEAQSLKDLSRLHSRSRQVEQTKPRAREQESIAVANDQRGPSSCTGNDNCLRFTRQHYCVEP